jgi:UDP-2,3-diacylglucosamine pyrophosphatase LpxH
MSAKKIKLVISDFHIGKGLYTEDGSLNPLEDFTRHDDFIEFLDYYSGDTFKRFQVELIINGDFLNLIQVDVSGEYPVFITEKIALEKLKAVIDGNRQIFDGLARFAATPGCSIVYIVGNHDQEFMWRSARDMFSDRVNAHVEFKDMYYRFDGVHIEHGNMYDRQNRFVPKRFFLTKGFKEPVLNIPWGSFFCIKFLTEIKKEDPSVDKVRPFRSYILWNMIFNSFGFGLKILFKAFLFVLVNKFKYQKYQYMNFKTTWRMARNTSLFAPLDIFARKILDRVEEVHTVVMGHSHQYRYRRWDDGKVYINTGTWSEYVNLSFGAFGRTEKMTYALIDYTVDVNKRDVPRAMLKEWKGNWKQMVDVRT